jgi:hypothetical protein
MGRSSSIEGWARIGAHTQVKLPKFILVCQEVRLDVMTGFGATRTFRNVRYRSLWDGKRTLRKPYSTSSIYEYGASKRAGRRGKFPAPHFETPASGNEPRHGDLAVRRAFVHSRRPGAPAPLSRRMFKHLHVSDICTEVSSMTQRRRLGE